MCFSTFGQEMPPTAEPVRPDGISTAAVRPQEKSLSGSATENARRAASDIPKRYSPGKSRTAIRFFFPAVFEKHNTETSWQKLLSDARQENNAADERNETRRDTVQTSGYKAQYRCIWPIGSDNISGLHLSEKQLPTEL